MEKLHLLPSHKTQFKASAFKVKFCSGLCWLQLRLVILPGSARLPRLWSFCSSIICCLQRTIYLSKRFSDDNSWDGEVRTQSLKISNIWVELVLSRFWFQLGQSINNNIFNSISPFFKVQLWQSCRKSQLSSLFWLIGEVPALIETKICWYIYPGVKIILTQFSYFQQNCGAGAETTRRKCNQWQNQQNTRSRCQYFGKF